MHKANKSNKKNKKRKLRKTKRERERTRNLKERETAEYERGGFWVAGGGLVVADLW